MISINRLKQSCCTILGRNSRLLKAGATNKTATVPAHISCAHRSFSLFNRARVVAVGRFDPHSTLLNQIKLKLRRQALLIRGEFLKKRSIGVNKGAAVGGGWGGVARATAAKSMSPGAGVATPPSAPAMVIQMSLAEFAGHASFICSALAFLEHDMLNLRLFATSSICFSILFQYYREIPLWLPIKWNFLFVLINVTMVGLLLKDEHLANAIPAEQKEIHQLYFSSEGLPRVEFMRLFDIANKHDFPEAGTEVIVQDAKSERVWFVVKGQVQVSRDGEPIALMSPGSFVGEMGFVKWRDAKAHVQALEKTEEREAEKRWHDEFHSSGEEAVHSAEIALSSAQKAWNKSMSNNPLKATLFEKPHRHRTPLKGKHAKKENKKVDERTADSLDVISTGVRATAGVVTSTKDCRLYSWKFSDLTELLAAEPALALVLERLFSADLQRKMRTNDIKVKYKYVLMGVLVNLEDKTKKIAKCKTGATSGATTQVTTGGTESFLKREYALNVPDQHTLAFVKKMRRVMRVTPAIHSDVLRELQVPESLFASTDNYDVEVDDNNVEIIKVEYNSTQ